MSLEMIISEISGKAVPVRGNDIDTDRIIPARYLLCTTFKELGPHAFQDDRTEMSKRGKIHPFDNKNYQEAGILLVNSNFGCGSSREHAPQALMRWGIKGIVGESFAEIFYGNCVSLGIPCLTLSHQNLEKAQEITEKDPGTIWKIDINAEKLEGPLSLKGSIAPSSKSQFLTGKWNPLQELLQNSDKINALAKTLPYLNSFR